MKDSCSFGSYSAALLRDAASCRALPAREMVGSRLGGCRGRSRTWARPRCSAESLCVVKAGFRQRAALRSQVLLWKVAAEESRQFAMHKGGAGIVPQRGAEGVFRALKIADLLQGAAQVLFGLGKIRLQFERGGSRRPLVQVPLLLQRIAQADVRLGKVRLQFQCAAAAGNRFVQLPLLPQGIAQADVRLGKVRLQFQCAAVAGDRFVQVPLLRARHCPG